MCCQQGPRSTGSRRTHPPMKNSTVTESYVGKQAPSKELYRSRAAETPTPSSALTTAQQQSWLAKLLSFAIIHVILWLMHADQPAGSLHACMTLGVPGAAMPSQTHSTAS